MAVPRIKPAIALTEAEERDAYPHPGRRLSKYEMLDQGKPLPRVPVPVRGPSPRDLRRHPGIRIPSHRPGQPYPQLKSLLQTSAVWNGAMSTQDRRVTDDTPYHSPSLHISEMVAPHPLGRDCRASSFDRGASGPRSSKKINQLIGHDLDLLPVDPYTLHEYSSAYGADYSEGASSSDSESGSDYEENEQCCLSLEEGLLPLLLEIDEESWLNRRDSWVPRTLKTVHVPPPLNVGRQGRLPSDGSASPCNSEHSPTHPPGGVNFRLSSELPVRWNPVYGQFTDRRAANDYHRFAAELATSCGSDKSPKRASSTLSKQHGSSGERLKKPKTTEKLRQASTAAITRLWDNARTKDARKQTSSTVSLPAFPPPPFAPPLRPLPPTPPAAPARAASPAPSLQGSTRKKHCPARLSAVGVPLPLPCPHRYTLFPRPSTPPPPPPAMQFQPRQYPPATQNSVFDYGSDTGEATGAADDDDDDDEAGRGAGRRWWRRSDEGERRSSSEWPAVQRLKRVENDKDKPSPLSSGSDDKEKPAPPASGDAKEKASSAGGVKGLFANARDLALLSPAERRRADLRKSIRVLRASELVEPRAPLEAPSPKSKSKVVKPKKTRQVRAYSHRSYFYSAGVFL